jgi:hypothetical protein
MAIVPTIVSSPDGMIPRSIVFESSHNTGPEAVFDAEEAFFSAKPVHPKTETNNTILLSAKIFLFIASIPLPQQVTMVKTRPLLDFQ